jgi:hypothetical protein
LKNPEIYIHTGMGRTGSTFLQHKVFPKFGNIYYRRHTKFRKAAKLIKKGKHERFLISGEMEYKKLERQMKVFSSHFPDARPVIMLRRQDEWLASQHRRFVKSGYALRYSEFLHLHDDSGFWERDWLRFMGNIEILEKYYTHKPLVLFFDELKADPQRVITQLANYMGATVHMSNINLSPKHASYNKKQLRAVYTLSKKINLVNKKPSHYKIVNSLINIFKNILRYSTLFLSPIIPATWLSKDSFLPEAEQLSELRAHFSEDWDQCVEYARKNKPGN